MACGLGLGSKKTPPGNLVLGSMVLMHVKDEVLEEGKVVDLMKFDVIGRLSGGTRYWGVRSVFEISSEHAKGR